MSTTFNEVSTLDAAYFEYIKDFPKKAVQLRTALFHYLLPYKGFGFDFEVKRGELLSAQKTETAWGLARRVKLEDLWEIDRVLTWQAEVFELSNAPRTTCRPNKHYLSHFLVWCKEQGYLKPKPQEAWEIPQSLPGTSAAYHRRGGRERQLVLNRQLPVEYRAKPTLFSEQTKLSLEKFTTFWTDPDYEGLRPISTIDVSSQTELLKYLWGLIGWFSLDKLDYHRQMRERARQREAKDASYASGWLLVEPEPPDWLQEMHAAYPPRALETIQLEDLVPVVEMRPDKLLLEEKSGVKRPDSSLFLQQLQNELTAQKATLSFETTIQLGQFLQQNQAFAEEVERFNQRNARETAQDQAKAAMLQACVLVRAHLKNFFKWLQYQHNPTTSPEGYRIAPSYREKFCNAEMNLAKFLYREITNPRTHPDYQDIEVVLEIQRVRSEARDAEFKPNSINPVKRNPTWRELGNLLKDLLIACAPRRTIDAAPEYRSMGPLREQTAVAADFEKYLIMMFFRVIAPDRQHVVRDLRTHDTLKLCWVNWETRTYEEAPWDQEQKCYKAFYNPNTRLYYLAIEDVKDQKGNIVDRPLGKEFAWVVFLDASQTKIDKDNAYRVPKIYNPELHTWLYGQEDYSGKWFNWPKLKMGQRKGITKSKWTKQQFHWCGYIDPETGMKAGFRATFKPTHDFVFTQRNGKPYSCSNMCRLYDAIIWRYLGVRSNPHAARSAVTSHFLLQGMDTPEESSLAQLKNHSVKTQSSPHYNKLAALEKTARASEMIVGEFLQERGLDPEQYGLVGGRPYQ